jgi:mevalonate pyrophosphate decarboxylase
MCKPCERKMEKVMREFKKKILRSHGKVVRKRRQAIAIGLSEARRMKS